MTRTFTLLITINDDRIPDAQALADQIATLLENGTSDPFYAAYSSASVDAVSGDCLEDTMRYGDDVLGDIRKIKRIHTAIRG